MAQTSKARKVMVSISQEEYAKIMNIFAELRRCINALHSVVENTYIPLELKGKSDKIAK